MEYENIRMANVTALPTRSTVKLDLANPPSRLNDQLLAEAQRMGREPLPDLPPVDGKYLAQCMRMMLAVLPRQNADEIGGELFVAAYKSHLGGFPQDAIEYLTHRATGELRWFPTIAECREIIGQWHRNDEAVHRRNLALTLAGRERLAREEEQTALAKPPAMREITMAEIEGMSDAMRALGVSCGAIIQTEDGRYVPA